MNHVRDQDVDWIRHDSGLAETLQYAIPEGYEAYGVLDLPRDIAPVEDELLDTLTTDPDQPLIAGWIHRGPWAPPTGDEHVLHIGWRYSFRHVRSSELRGLPTEGEGSFPDLLFPPDRSCSSPYCGTTRGEASAPARPMPHNWPGNCRTSNN